MEGADMKRLVLLGTLLAAGAATMAAQTPAASKIIDIVKLKDNMQRSLSKSDPPRGEEDSAPIANCQQH